MNYIGFVLKRWLVVDYFTVTVGNNTLTADDWDIKHAITTF